MLGDLARAEKTRIGKAGRKAEKKTLSKMGAQPTPNSGASGSKGDGALPGFLMECKSTVHQSMSVKLDHLSKITGEAHAAGVEPCLAIIFTDGSGTPVREGTWICIPQEVFEELTDE
jgi:hypothetical protein